MTRAPGISLTLRPTRDLARRMPRTLEEAAYEEGMDIIILGLLDV